LTCIRAEDPPPPPPVPALPEGVEVQARGPVHEAYAEPGDVRPEATPLVPKAPPEPISELPPEQKPDGDNVQWIPGYWAWDQDKNDYLWVSGFWRIPPPNRQWVPGTWQEVEGGWQWVPGFWGPVGQEDWQYLPTPPPSLDDGPSTPAPQANSTYVPGCWIFRQSRFMWRPGFWCPYQPGWLWIPAHYVWTPGGCLFVEGYWDHPLEARGLLFAPVRLANRLLTAANWAFTPQFVVQPDFLMGALFVQPRLGHYYFGDFFEDRYRRGGFVPWMDYRIGRAAYDPNFNYYRLAFANYGGWERGLRGLYQARYRGDIPRPPRTLVQQNELIQNFVSNRTTNEVINRNINITNMQNALALAPLTQLHNTRVTNLANLAQPRSRGAELPAFSGHVLKLRDVPREQRLQEQKAASQLHAVAQQRRKTEAGILSEGPPVRVTDRPRQGKITLPARPGETHATPRPAETTRTPQPVRPSERPATPPPPKTPKAPVTVPQHRPVPPTPAPPRHEERPIPKHEAPRAPAPPKPATPPRPPAPPKQAQPPQEKPRPPAPPKQAQPPQEKPRPPAPPKPATPPPPPPKREKPPPPPPKK
jgi:hypothetical protein